MTFNTGFKQAKKDIIRNQFYKEICDEGNLNFLDKLFSPDFAFYPAGSSEKVDLQSLIDYLAIFRRALKFYHTIDEQITEENKVMTRWTVHGTHQEEFLGFPPTGNPVIYSGVSIFHFSDKKIYQARTFFDELGMMTKLGFTVVSD